MARGSSSIGARAACFPFIERIFADAGYQGPALAAAVAKTGTWILEIVKRNELHRFVVLPKRWIVERTLAWISRNRRLARDFERYARTVAAFIRLAKNGRPRRSGGRAEGYAGARKGREQPDRDRFDWRIALG